ncbi:MAG: hypothetical protein EDX89_11390 [Acidobacteria bacterium]|nr:MAG: hypothetical protein EDX89_11390 [Acidobacteriota bacterium]MCE7957046.1 hypothetical protein [Acidobacteria bacterium ACB2]
MKGLLEGEWIAGWGPEERTVFVHRGGEIPARLYRVDTVTGAREPVRDVAPSDLASVTGVFPRITPDGRACAYNVPQFLSEIHLVEGLR